MKDEDIELIKGSGNVFRDFGDSEADQAKAILAARVIVVLDERGLSVRKAASVTGFAAADFSCVRNADLGRFALDRLMKMIGALDDRIRVTIQVAPREAGQAGHPLETAQDRRAGRGYRWTTTAGARAVPGRTAGELRLPIGAGGRV